MKNNNYWLIAVVLFAVVLRLFFAFGWHELWWDSGVYIGMGKFAFSSGEAGLWEHIRPPLVPLALGFLWKLGLDPAFFGRLIEILLMGGIVYFIFRLAEFWFDRRVAVLSSLIVALSPIFFHLSFHQYTEIPSMFFALFGLWCFVKARFVWAGVLTGLAFLSKFPVGIFFLILFILIAYHRQWKELIKLSAGFALVSLPYFIWSWLAYGSLFATLAAARETIGLALGCNVFRAKPWYFYFWVLVFSETKLYFFALPGIAALKQKWERKHSLFVLSILLPLIYLLQLHCRDYRYATLFIPFVAVLTALGVVYLIDLLPKNRRSVGFYVVLAVCSVWILHTSILFYQSNSIHVPDPAQQQYFNFLANHDVEGEVWVSDPSIAAFTDKKLGKIYYPIYDEGLARDFDDYLDSNGAEIGAVLLDNCGGGIICPPFDDLCEQRTSDLFDKLDARMSIALDVQSGRCWYKVWVNA